MEDFFKTEVRKFIVDAIVESRSLKPDFNGIAIAIFDWRCEMFLVGRNARGKKNYWPCTSVPLWLVNNWEDLEEALRIVIVDVGYEIGMAADLPNGKYFEVRKK